VTLRFILVLSGAPSSWLRARRIKWCERPCACIKLHGVSPGVQSNIISLYNYVIKTFSLLCLKLRAVPIRIPNRNRNRFCTSHTQCVTFVTVIKSHNFAFVTSVTRSVFFQFFLAKQVWSHFGHKYHKWSQIQIWLVQPCFCFCFDWNGSEWTKYGKTCQKVSSVSVFCLEFGSERLSGPKGCPSKFVPIKQHISLVSNSFTKYLMSFKSIGSRIAQKRFKDTRMKFTRRQTNLLRFEIMLGEKYINKYTYSFFFINSCSKVLNQTWWAKLNSFRIFCGRKKKASYDLKWNMYVQICKCICTYIYKWVYTYIYCACRYMLLNICHEVVVHVCLCQSIKSYSCKFMCCCQSVRSVQMCWVFLQSWGTSESTCAPSVTLCAFCFCLALGSCLVCPFVFVYVFQW